MRITNTHIYFYTGIYSNWHPCKFQDTLDGVMEWNNTEQAFMYYKAKFFGDSEIARKICYETDPRKAKELGRQVKNFNSLYWQMVSYGYMVYVNYLKFSQNEEFKKELLATENKILVEASPYDTIWGVGLDKYDDDILDETKWKGLNLLGKALMEVRLFV